MIIPHGSLLVQPLDGGCRRGAAVDIPAMCCLSPRARLRAKASTAILRAHSRQEGVRFRHRSSAIEIFAAEGFRSSSGALGQKKPSRCYPDIKPRCAATLNRAAPRRVVPKAEQMEPSPACRLQRTNIMARLLYLLQTHELAFHESSCFLGLLNMPSVLSHLTAAHAKTSKHQPNHHQPPQWKEQHMKRFLANSIKEMKDTP